MLAKYQMIANEIRTKIKQQIYQDNQVIPSELQLQKDYGVSRHTIRQAIALLVNEGYLRKEKGSGTYVDDAFKRPEMKQPEYKTIGVITTYLSDYIFPSIIRGIEKTLSENGYSLLLASTNNDYQQEKECLEKMMGQNVQGLIVEPTKSNQYNPNLALYAQLREQGIPIVMINAKYEELELPLISVNDVEGGYLAATALIKQGHRKLIFITKLDDLQGKYRLKGFIKACSEHQIAFTEEDIYTYTTETRKDILLEVVARFQTDTETTGIVCYNDQFANRLCTALLDLGKQIPADISIVGNDNSTWRRVGELELSTLEHPKEKLGQDAGTWMIETIKQGKNQGDIIYAPQFVEGNSIKKIK